MTYRYEIDFHPVGEASKSGDAISAKFTAGLNFEVLVIDGGTIQSGEEVAQSISDFYGTRFINRMVLTHPDDDHSSGLRVLMEQCQVGELWMHRPWLYAEDLVGRLKYGWTVQGLKQELRKSFPIVAELEETARAGGIPIYEPFAGAQIGPFTVVSPSKDFYLDLLPNMSRTPEPADQFRMYGIGQQSKGNALSNLKNTIYGVFESWLFESLDDSGETSASNESSVVLYSEFDNKRILLTSDAGRQALQRAADFCELYGLPLRRFNLISMPHHGSRRNVGPSLLDRIVGPIAPEGSEANALAIASASKKDEDHPKRVVMNAFRRRGCPTAKTEGDGIMVMHNVNSRPGFGPLPNIPIYSHVEE